MPVLKQSGSRLAIKEAVVLDLGDLGRQAAQLRLAAEAKAAKIIGEAEKEAGQLVATASGTFPCDGMIIAPCSIRTLSAVANSHSSDLLTSTADVTLKEKRPLVLMVRETPFHLGHLRLMPQVAEIGGVSFPPVPAFYNKHRDLDEVISHTAKRALEQAGIEIKEMDR